MTKQTFTWLAALAVVVALLVGIGIAVLGPDERVIQVVPATGAAPTVPPSQSPTLVEPSLQSVPPSGAPGAVPPSPAASEPPGAPSSRPVLPLPRPRPTSSAATTMAPLPAPAPPTESPSLAPPIPPIPPIPPTSPSSAPGPDTSQHIPARYVQNYDARRVGWDDVIDRGKRLPGVSKSCARSWRNSGKDARLAWGSGTFACMSSLMGGGFKPQGVSGSATTQLYDIEGVPAAQRDIILVTWYSRGDEPGRFDNAPGESVTRLLVIDRDRRRYNVIELVRPSGSDRLENLNSHGSGLVWTGQYLYTSSHSALWMYNADDILRIGGRFVLPAVAGWSVQGHGGLSSISVDRSSTPSQLKGINYTDGQAYVQSFELAADGSVARGSELAEHDLVLRRKFGDVRRVVHSSTSFTIPGTGFQGVAAAGPYGFANSSALRLRRGSGAVDAMVVIKNGRVIERFRMPRGNVESIYIDYLRSTYTSITEHGSQFLFELPLIGLTERAER